MYCWGQCKKIPTELYEIKDKIVPMLYTLFEKQNVETYASLLLLNQHSLDTQIRQKYYKKIITQIPHEYSNIIYHIKRMKEKNHMTILIHGKKHLRKCFQ